MKNIAIASFAGATLLGFVGAGMADQVVIAPEQQTIIREYVQKEPLASIQLPGVELNIGTALPDTVVLHKIPDVQYEYVVIDNRTVVVDPGSRKVIQILD